MVCQEIDFAVLSGVAFAAQTDITALLMDTNPSIKTGPGKAEIDFSIALVFMVHPLEAIGTPARKCVHRTYRSE